MLGYLLSPVLQIEDTNGLPLVNGKVYVYEANTSNLATIYSNYEGTLNTNPAILDLAGHTTIIADDILMYDITVKDKDDNLLFSAENVAVGGEGGSASVSDVTVRAGGNGINVVQSVENNTKVFTVSIDYSFVASKSDLNSKQNVLTPGANISISGDTISVTGLKTINVIAPLQKTETSSAINLSIDTSGIQPTLSAGTNIDAAKLSNNIVDLKSVDCSAYTNSIAIGKETLATGNCSFAEGDRTSAVGYYSHSEGYKTYAADFYSHAEGDETSAIGQYAHSEGYRTVASGNDSHSEGDRTQAIGYQSHSEGYKTSASGPVSHAEGDQTIASGNYSHAEGDRTRAIGIYSHAEGEQTSAIGERSHAEGYYTIASGDWQTVIGKYNNPNTTDLFQIGCGSADNDRQNALEVRRYNTTVVGYYNNVSGNNNFVAGSGNYVSGNNVNVIGKNNNLKNYADSGYSEIVLGSENSAYSVNPTSTKQYENTIIGHKNTFVNVDEKYTYQNQIFGDDNNVSGNYTKLSIFGYSNILSGGDAIDTFYNHISHSVVEGVENSLSGNIGYAVVNGFRNGISGYKVYDSIAIGTNNKIINGSTRDLCYSTLVGHNNELYLPSSVTTAGNNNVLVGYGNKVSAYNNMAFGNNNTIDGEYSVAVGSTNSVNSNNSMVFGYNLSGDADTVKIGIGSNYLKITRAGIYKCIKGTETAL